MVGKRRFNGLDLAHALDLGAKQAYKAVPKPVEGTILTVIREAAAAAVAAAERDNNVETVLAATVDAAERAVAKTPSLLPILREAHVVDSGGQGLFRLFQGALDVARQGAAAEGGRTARPDPRTGARAPSHAHVATGATEETEYGYETVYLVRALPGRPLDVDAISAHLVSIGDSVLVAGDDRLAKIHVHNERPDAVIAYGLSVGRAVPDHHREPRRPGARRARGEGRGVRRRGGRARRRGACGDRHRRGRGGDRGRPGAGRREPPAAGRRRGRPVGGPRRDPRRHRRPVPRVRRVPGRARRAVGQPVDRRAPRGGQRDPGRRAADPAQQPQRRARRAPGRVDDRPPDPRRADAQRRGGRGGAVRARPGAPGRRERGRDDDRRARAPDACR